MDFFLFSSRRRHTRYWRDWSSDVCSSDLIGRPPEHEAAAPSGGFVDAPTNSTILGSAKLSGKTPGGWSLGVLDAVTAREQATLADSNGVRWRDDVEPLTNYLVGRVRREIGGHTGFGLLATAVAR